MLPCQGLLTLFALSSKDHIKVKRHRPGVLLLWELVLRRRKYKSSALQDEVQELQVSMQDANALSVKGFDVQFQGRWWLALKEDLQCQQLSSPLFALRPSE